MFQIAINGGNGACAATGILTAPETRWPPAPRDLVLAGDEVHIFCVALDLLPRRMKQLARTLSEDERLRAARFHFAHDRDRFIAARGQLREIIGRFLEIPASAVVFAYGERGKPMLAEPVDGRFVHFNLSHSEGLSLVAICRDCEVGVDIERVRPVDMTEPMVTPFFSEEELKQWYKLPPSRRAEAFFDNWTRTEAYLKFNGEGIGDYPNPIFQCDGDCLMQSLRPAPGYAGAIVVENPTAQIHCWKWESPVYVLRR